MYMSPRLERKKRQPKGEKQITTSIVAPLSDRVRNKAIASYQLNGTDASLFHKDRQVLTYSLMNNTIGAEAQAFHRCVFLLVLASVVSLFCKHKETAMVNIKVGDRVVDRTTDKIGVVESFVRPLSFGYKSKVYARVRLENGNTVNVEPHNLSLAEGYDKPKYDPVGINAQQNPNDKSEALTPAKPKRKGKKSEDKTPLDDIVDATTV